MIKSLTLNNFQSHKNTHLEFHPGVNIIVGQTDSGKTAIIRALRWLRWNRPSGDEFRSDWGGDTKVIMNVDNVVITRLKTKSDNQYQIFFDELNYTTFSAIKTDVPDEITQALNIGEINLQQQLDSPFLLSESPGAVAEHFNKVAHLDQIDLGLKNMQSWIRTLEQDVKSDQQRVEELRTELHRFDHLEQFEIDIEVLEGMNQNLITKANQKSRLTDIISELNQILTAEQDLQSIISLEVVLSPILEATMLRTAKKQEKEDIYALLDQIDSAESKIAFLSNLTVMEGLVNQLIGWNEQLDAKWNKIEPLKELYNDIEDTAFEYDQKMTKLKAMETTFHNEMPDVCPLCGQNVKKIN